MYIKTKHINDATRPENYNKECFIEQEGNMEGLTEEKKIWMKEVEILKFEKPQVYYAKNIPGCTYSEDYIKNKPIEILKKNYNRLYENNDVK